MDNSTENFQNEQHQQSDAAIKCYIAELERQIADLKQAYIQLETQGAEQVAEMDRLNQALAQEVIERIEVEKSLLEERRLLHDLMDNIPDAIYFKDIASRFTRINRAEARLLGIDDPNVALGKSDADFQAPELTKIFIMEEKEIIISGQSVITREEWNPAPDGTPRWFSTTKVPVKDAEGQVTGIVGISRDITQLKQAAQQALELEKERERVKLLSDFVKNTSHDFRTPLAIISSSVYLLSKATDPEKQKRHIENVEHQISRLTRLIDRLQEMGRLDSQISFTLHQVNVNQLVSDFCAKLAFEVKKKGVTLITSLCKSDLMVQADLKELILALTELGTNALWYTPLNGIITIRTKQQEDRAVIEVCDTGIGIPSADLPHIFERLYRVDVARTVEAGGTGLGLAIAKRIIELHQGSIMVESVIGEGSLFRVFLPLSQ